MATQTAPAPSPSVREPEQAPADVELAGVRKSYGDVVAVAGVDLSVARGEFFTLLGPSGSGKTTTLRLIAGFERPDAGRIRLAREDGRQPLLVPCFLAVGLTSFSLFALALVLTFTAAPAEALPWPLAGRWAARERAG